MAHNGNMPQLDELTVEGGDARGFTVYASPREQSAEQARLGYRFHPPSAGWNLRSKRHGGDVRLSDPRDHSERCSSGVRWLGLSTLRNQTFAFGLSL